MSIPTNALMVGKIVSVGIKAGDRVKRNNVVSIMKTLKMYVKIFASKRWYSQRNQCSPWKSDQP